MYEKIKHIKKIFFHKNVVLLAYWTVRKNVIKFEHCTGLKMGLAYLKNHTVYITEHVRMIYLRYVPTVVLMQGDYLHTNSPKSLRFEF